MDWKIIYYTERERQPVKEFIDAQLPKAKAKILRNLLLLSEFGPDIGYPLISNIERNLWELRTVYQGNQYRILFAVISGKIILLIHGFQKKTQKIPKKDLDLAKRRLKQFLMKGGH
jgi:phage-related protein